MFADGVILMRSLVEMVRYTKTLYARGVDVGESSGRRKMVFVRRMKVGPSSVSSTDAFEYDPAG